MSWKEVAGVVIATAVLISAIVFTKQRLDTAYPATREVIADDMRWIDSGFDQAKIRVLYYENGDRCYVLNSSSGISCVHD